jgi:uncharacterized protein (UPF0548 family)
MFLASRPSHLAVERFLGESQKLPLSYEPIGIVNGIATHRDVIERVFSIGHGMADFERARDALTRWKQFEIGWVELFPQQVPATTGTVVAVLINHLGFWSMNGCRVVYEFGPADDATRFGYAHGTLTNHAESGEEIFEVFLDRETGEVMTGFARRRGRGPRSLGWASQSCVCFRRASFAIQHNRCGAPAPSLPYEHLRGEGRFLVEWRQVP